VSKKKTRDALFRHEHLKLLGLRWRKRVVSGYVRARVVHYADNHMCGYPHGQWVMLLRERYRAALGLDNPPLMLDRAPSRRPQCQFARPPRCKAAKHGTRSLDLAQFLEKVIQTHHEIVRM
jgi:trans-aconitate methyltransferase